MSQVNRYIKSNKDLDQVDHALGRPYKVFDSYRNHFATSDPDQIAKFRSSNWWDEGKSMDDMVFFHVTDAGRHALQEELSSNVDLYGRLFEVTKDSYEGIAYIVAKSHSAAKYQLYIQADLDCSFLEYFRYYCDGLSIRLAK